MYFNEEEKNMAIAEEYCQAGFDKENPTQQLEEARPLSLSISPIYDYLSFLEISCICLQKFDKSKYSIDMVRYLKRTLARYIIRNFPPNTVLEKASLFCGSVEYNGSLFNELYVGIDFVLESEHIFEDIIEQMETLYNSNNRDKKRFGHEPYPYIRIPQYESCIHKFFLDEKIYNSIFEEISEKDWNNLSNENQLRIQEIKKIVDEIKNDDEIIGKWKSNVCANLTPKKDIEKEVKIEEEDVSPDSKEVFDAREVALFTMFLFDEFVGKGVWNTKGSKEFGHLIAKFSRNTMGDMTKKVDKDLAGYKRNIEYVKALNRIDSLFRSFYIKKTKNSDDYTSLNNILNRINEEKQKYEEK